MGTVAPAETSTTMTADVKTFVDGVLTGIGAPVNKVTETAMLNWLANEQGGPQLTAFETDKGNPLGVQTVEGAQSGRTGNIQGGVDATVTTLLGGNYAGVVNSFRAGNSVSAINSAIVASTWNRNHYGGLNVFTKTAGGGGGNPLGAGGYLPIAQAGGSGLTGSTPGSSSTPAQSSGTGCNAKGQVWGGIDLKVTSVGGFTYCELKALLGGLAMASGGVLIVVGLATLVVGGLGTKPVSFLGAASGVAPAIQFVKRVAPKRKPKAAPAEETTEEAA